VATPEDVEASLAEATRVLRETLAVDLIPAVEPIVRTIDVPAPSAALDRPARGLVPGRRDGGAFFRRHREPARHGLRRLDHGLRRPTSRQGPLLLGRSTTSPSTCRR
jgi:hypothetical protein